MANESSFTPKISSTSIGKTSPSQSDNSSRGSNRDMEIQISFTPKRLSPLSSRTKTNQSDD